MRLGRAQEKWCVNRTIDGNKWTLQTDTSIIALVCLFRFPAHAAAGTPIQAPTPTQKVFHCIMFVFPLQ